MTRTTSQSETMVVPPVTDERSPPASRMTGADSPVMALSLTEATPSMISPSAGDQVAGLDEDHRARLEQLHIFHFIKFTVGRVEQQPRLAR